MNTNDKHLHKSLEILKNIYIDANMALEDTWDRSDSGFEAQIQLIEEFFNEVGAALPDESSWMGETETA